MLPRPLARLGTFLLSGFLLHDIPFGDGVELLRGRPAVPRVTLLLAIFGALVLATDAIGMDLVGRPAWARAGVNAALLGAGFGLRWAIMAS